MTAGTQIEQFQQVVMILQVLLVAWVIGFGTIGFLIAGRKGVPRWVAAVFCGLLGIFGVLYLLMKPDVQRD